MNNDKIEIRTADVIVPSQAFIDEQIGSEIESSVQRLTKQKVEALINRPTFRTMDEVEAIEEINHSKVQTNALSMMTIADILIILISVFLALRSEVLLAQNIFEKVLKISVEKSFHTALGITVLFFATAVVIKPLVKRFLQTKKQTPKFFVFAIFMSCVVLFMLGGLSYYNIDKNNNRQSVLLLLSTQLNEAKDSLEDNPTEQQALQTSARLEKQIDIKLDTVNNTPQWIKNIALFAIATLSVIMLFCSAFLKSVAMVFTEAFLIKKKRERYRNKMYKSHQKYKTMVTRINNSYRLAEQYITFVIRQSVIEELLALVPNTQDYRSTIKERSNYTNGVTTNHKTFNSKF